MMGWYGNAGWGGWLAMTLMMLLFWVPVIGVIAWMFRSSATPSRGGRSAATPEQVLRDRLASGDLGIEDYQARLAALRGLAAPTDVRDAGTARPGPGRGTP